MDWTTDWPEEPGWYWFFGWCFRSRNHAPEMCLVKIRTTANNRPMRVTNGHFLYKEENGFGVWLPAMVPKEPHSHLGLSDLEERMKEEEATWEKNIK